MGFDRACHMQQLFDKMDNPIIALWVRELVLLREVCYP